MFDAMIAASQYANRPTDERFETIDALVANAADDKDHCKERRYNLKDLKVVPVDSLASPADAAGTTVPNTLMLESPKGRAYFSHWSFGQAARMVGAPAGYLRSLPPTIAADALNHGLKTSPVGTTANVLVRLPNGQPFPTVRACTSETYGRVWDAPLYSALQSQIMHDSRWELPPTWEGPRAGAYRGDRDSFLIVTNGGSIVQDPSLRNGPSGGDQMYRGLIVRNSEVGGCSVYIDQILFRFICGNHILWGAMLDRRFRRRHVGVNTLSDTVREIGRIAQQWTESSVARDQAIINGLISHDIAETKEAVIDELRKMGASKEDAESAYDRCERTEAASPRSFWGMAQGLTRVSQDSQYQDDRFMLDQLAAKVLSRGARLVAA